MEKGRAWAYIKCAIFLFILFCCSTVLAVNYFVKTNGNNTLLGTSWAQAWRNINYATTNHIAILSAGDIVTVSNGTYSERVFITNKGVPGNNIIIAAMNPFVAVINGSGYDQCFYLTNSSYIRINGFTIKKAVHTGVYLSGSCQYNSISNNNICSNVDFGINDAGSYNRFANNSIYGPFQQNGVKVSANDWVQNNLINYNTVDGIYAVLANTIMSNTIYKNGSSGISMLELSGDNNIVRNNSIYSNVYGIYIYSSHNQKISCNRIYGNSQLGIIIGAAHYWDPWYSSHILIQSNKIYSNPAGGIRSDWAPTYLDIEYNEICGPNQNDGIYMGCKYSTIRSNAIHNHPGTGIYLWENCYENQIARNDIYSNTSQGIYFHGGWQYFYNNNAISNRIHSNGYGVVHNYFNAFSHSTYFFMNRIYKNSIAGIYNSGVCPLSSSTIDDNEISSNSQYGIMLYSGISSITRNRIFNNQINGIAVNGAGSSVSIYQTNKIFGNYESGIYLQSGDFNNVHNNLIFGNTVYGMRVLANNNTISSNQIAGPGQKYGVYVSGGDYENISWFNRISHNDIYGLVLTNGAMYSGISNNLIMSNGESGIFIHGAQTCNNNIIKNRICGSNQKNGLVISSSRKQTCRSNTIYYNKRSGIDVLNSTTNYISMNCVYSNNQYGVFLEGSSGGNNSIFSNQIFGQHQNGIRIDSSDQNALMYNQIFLNFPYGVLITNQAQFNKIGQNLILKNGTGVCFNNSTSSTLYRNAISGDQSNGIFVKDADQNAIINNSLVSNGLNSGHGLSINNSANNIVKNNIFGYTRNGFGVTLVSGLNNSLSYNDSFSNFLGNYQNIVPGIGCISNNALWLSYDPVSSNYLYLSNQSPCLDAGDPADPVPAGGNDRVDMGWKEFVRPFVSLQISKTVDGISLPGVSVAPAVPGSLIRYALNCKINCYGNESANSVIVRDQVFNSHLIYMTNYFMDSGWDSEYSTNQTPDQSYGSLDFGPLPAEKTNIHWVRWKRLSAAGGLRTFYLKSIVK